MGTYIYLEDARKVGLETPDVRKSRKTSRHGVYAGSLYSLALPGKIVYLCAHSYVHTTRSTYVRPAAYADSIASHHIRMLADHQLVPISPCDCGLD